MGAGGQEGGAVSAGESLAAAAHTKVEAQAGGQVGGCTHEDGASRTVHQHHRHSQRQSHDIQPQPPQHHLCTYTTSAQIPPSTATDTPTSTPSSSPPTWPPQHARYATTRHASAPAQRRHHHQPPSCSPPVHGGVVEVQLAAAVVLQHPGHHGVLVQVAPGAARQGVEAHEVLKVAQLVPVGGRGGAWGGRLVCEMGLQHCSRC